MLPCLGVAEAEKRHGLGHRGKDMANGSKPQFL
jgi:hypothetical protein